MALLSLLLPTPTATTNRRLSTSPLLRLRPTNPLICRPHLSPSLPLSFHRKRLQPCVAFTTSAETEQTNAHKHQWYRVSSIEHLDPTGRTPFVLPNSSGIIIWLLKDREDKWIAFNDEFPFCRYHWPVQGCIGCSPSPSSDGRVRVCANRFPTLESQGVLFVWPDETGWQQATATKPPFIIKPTDIMTSSSDGFFVPPEVIANYCNEDLKKEQATVAVPKPRGSHINEDLKKEQAPVAAPKPRGSHIKQDSVDVKSSNDVPRSFVSPIVKGAQQIFIEKRDSLAEFLKSTTESPVVKGAQQFSIEKTYFLAEFLKSTIKSPVVIGALQFLCIGALHLLFQKKEIIIPLFQELCKKIVHLFADFLKQYFKKSLQAWSEKFVSFLITKYLGPF